MIFTSMVPVIGYTNLCIYTMGGILLYTAGWVPPSPSRDKHAGEGSVKILYLPTNSSALRYKV